MPDVIVVGLDVGGSTTRATVVDTGGERWGAGRAGGGNPTSHGADAAAVELRAALTDALAGIDPGEVRAGAIGLAGAGRLLADPAARAAFDRAWHDVGLRCGYAVHGDALVGYASGTSSPDGTILIAGTGAIAAEVRDLALARVADGHGWLLGDAGSGFWLGREAVRRTLAELDRHRDTGRIGALVRDALLGSTGPDSTGPDSTGLDSTGLDSTGLDSTGLSSTGLSSTEMAEPPRRTVDALVQAVTRRPPVELARLAPLVVSAAEDGDDAARRILAEAAGHLVGSVRRIRPADADTPIVLGGGLLTGDTPLAHEVGAALRDRWPDAAITSAGDGALAAAWLAARTLPEVDDPIRLHERLFGPAG